MKHYLVHILLLLALLGQLGHSFHVHHDKAGGQCPICIVDDISKVTIDHYVPPVFESSGYQISVQSRQIQLCRSAPRCRNRAPPKLFSWLLLKNLTNFKALLKLCPASTAGLMGAW